MNEIEMARWQGAIDERTKVIERRMDSLNGDVRTIRNDISEIKTSTRETTLVSKALHDQRSKWLEGWRVRLLTAGGVFTALAALTNIVLNALS